jgi:hypothetical protein
MKKIVTFILVQCISFNSIAEVICNQSSASSAFESCSIESSSDPSECSVQDHPILEHTMVNQKAMQCDDQQLMSQNSSNNRSQAYEEYRDLCKKKAKAYKRALMGNLLSKGKLGQLVQVFFKKKRFKTDVDEFAMNASLDAQQLRSKSDSELEALMLDELQKQFVEKQKEAGGDGSLNIKQMAQEAIKDPEFQKGFHEVETVPLNVIAKTEGGQFCEVKVDKLPILKDQTIEKCDFCVEKNISSSFTNDCAYMVSSKYPESESKKLLNFSQKSDYCNNSMDNEQNDLSEVETMVDRICQIAKKRLRPEFNIETSRNLYRDKTKQLAAKRGEFIQKYIRDQLINGRNPQGTKRCDLGEELPEWLEEKNFKKAVQVTHPYYEGGKEGDYGPDPYVSSPQDQQKEVEKLQKTLAYEKTQIQKKLDQARVDQKKIIEQNKSLKDVRDGKDGLSKKYGTLKKSLESSKVLNEDVFAKEEQIKQIQVSVHDIDSKYNHNRQMMSDLDQQIVSYESRLKVIDAQNKAKIELLNKYYQEKNTVGDAGLDHKQWDDRLFNDFKMVRITGKAVEDDTYDGESKNLPPAVKIALNAMAEVEQFTCVVEPIRTSKTNIKGVLKGGLKVVTAIASPVVVLGAIGAVTVAAPVTGLLSFFCEGCGKPGNIPPVLRFANPRLLSFKKSARKAFKRDLKAAWKSYINWGGLLKTKYDKDYFDNETEEVYEDQQERKNK